MREILFRGQIRKNGEKVYMNGEPVHGKWLYGFGVLQGKGDFSVLYDYNDGDLKKSPVYTETIGQYTGLRDKNGKRIFEGDVVKCDHFANECIGVVVFGRYQHLSQPKPYDIGFWFKWDGKLKKTLRPDLGFLADCEYLEVIGNIHDNPELLEVSDDA